MGSAASVISRDSVGKAGDDVKKWRNDGLEPWNATASLNLKNSIMKYVKALAPLQQIEIIVCGSTGHGKSSLINNCIAALSGIYSQVAQVGRGEEQVTQEYRRFQTWQMEDGSVMIVPLIFYDTRGFSESKKNGVPVAAIKACIMGNVASGEPMKLNVANTFWENRQQIGQKVSYIFFVGDATEIPDKYTSSQAMKSIYQNLRQISTFAKKEGIQVAAFVTKCDELDPYVKTNTNNIHYSASVERKVNVFSQMVDIAVNRVFPVVNYTHQTTVTDEMKIQTLLALKACLEDIVGVRVGDIHTPLQTSGNV